MKRLHVIYFVDSGNTKTFALKLNVFFTIVIAIVATLALASISFFKYFKIRLELKKSREYVSELKTEIIHKGAEYEKIFSKSFLEKESALPPVKKQSDITTAVPTVQNKPVAAVIQKPAQDVTSFLSKNPIPSLTTQAISFSAVNDKNTQINFVLENSQPRIKLIGKVCLVAHIFNEKNKASPKFLSLPQSLITSDFYFTQLQQLECKNGQPVKFNSLRPTTLNLPTDIDSIEEVAVIFTLNTPIKDQNNNTLPSTAIFSFKNHK